MALPWQPAPSVGARTSPGACTPGDWLAKYMSYRTRFRGDGTARNPGFIVPGEGPGTAMPASRRQPDAACPGYWEFGDCPRPDLADATGIYKWGDGTSWLGHYYDVLALEYAMFSQMGLPTDETLSDLKHALAAYERLDAEAESYFGVPAAADGFFLRDDLFFDIIKKADGSYTFPRDDGYAGYECIAGDIACHAPSTADGSYTSEDQTIALLHGLGLVAALVPDGVVVDGMDIRAEARGAAHRMTMGLRDHGWKVTDPTGEHPPDAWGGNAIGFSNHIAGAANAICGDDFGVDDYRNLLSRTAGEAAWGGIQVIWSLTPWYNRVMVFMLAAVDGAWDGEKIATKALGNGSDFYAMTWAIMHGETLPAPWSDWRIEALLDSAPCGGPCIGVSAAHGGCDEASGWRGESRILEPGDVDGSRNVGDAEFNGMDYMAYYAAYYLYKHGHVGFTVPEPDRGCGAVRMLDGILSGPIAEESYDPAGACAGVDMEKRFCGRPFANWLDDAYGGRVQIFTGGLHWICTPGAPCVLTDDGMADSDGDDLVIGTGGDDELEGGDGNDCLVGLGGDDILEGNQGYDTLDGGDGNDQLFGESGNLVVVDGEGDILWGGAGDDKLKGGPGDDFLIGGPGDDELVGDAGSDSLDGGDGNDKLWGDLGEDRLRGGDGDDALDCGFGDDTAWGGPGRDKIDGDLGKDALDGGPGDDFIRGGMGDDSISDGAGADRLCGNGGDDVIWSDWSGTDQCLGGGWLFGGKDQVNGCTDETATTGDCDKGAYDSW
ncbi:MAG: calcium-binding protein [Myxococcota bacterium]